MNALNALEPRALLSAALGVTFDTTHFDPTAVLGEKYKSTLRVTFTNMGDAPVTKSIPALSFAIDAVADHPRFSPPDAPVIPDLPAVKVAGLKPGQSRSFNLKMSIDPKATRADTYTITANTLTTDTSHDLPVNVNAAKAALTVSQPATNTNAAIATALALSDDKTTGTLTLKNNGKATLHGSAKVVLYASLPSGRDLQLLGSEGYQPVGILSATSKTVTLPRLKRGETTTITVDVPQPSAESTPLEFFAVVDPTDNFQPALSDAPVLATAAFPDAQVASTPVTPDDVAHTKAFESLTGPVAYRVLGTTTPTTAFRGEYGLFVDGTGRQGSYTLLYSPVASDVAASVTSTLRFVRFD